MVKVGAFYAKTHLPALLERVVRGEVIQITQRGMPVAMLVPMGKQSSNDAKKAALNIRQFRNSILLGEHTVKKLIDKGRRH